MDAIQLLKPNGELSGVWYCQKCRHVSSDEGASERCCVPRICPECDKTIEGGGLIRHEACWMEWRYQEAEKLTEWDGWIYCEEAGDAGNGEGYFDSVESLIEQLEDNGQDIPEWVFVCKETRFFLDIDRAIENVVDDMFEDTADSLNGIDDLRAAVKVFNEANKSVVSYYPDYSRVLQLSPAIIESTQQR